LGRSTRDLDETPDTAGREPEAGDAAMESWAGMVRETLEDLAPEERLRSYTLLRLCVRFRPDRLLDMSGLFDGEAENGLSYCKLSPLSV